MSEGLDDISTAVAALANRLRLGAGDFTDAPAEQRREHLSAEIERALNSIVPSERQAFLRALEDRFPSWDRQVPLAAPTNGQASHSEADAKELTDVNFLAQQLARLGQPLPESLLAQLRSAGVIPVDSGTAGSPQSLHTLRTKLQLGDQRRIDPERLVQLTLDLIDLTASLHQLIGTAWRTLSPASDTRYRQGALISTMGKFLASDPNVNRQQLETDIEKMRQMIASLVAAIGDVGRQFASQYVARFGPPQIKAAASSEPGMFMTLEAKCWRKYVEVWDTLDESGIEREIRESVAKYADTLLKGLAR